jgi:putative ABC transport system permease protein
VPGATNVATIQRDLVQRFPNVSAIDLALITSTVERIVGKVSTAIRFMALFSLAMGIPVLISAVAATRRERIREGVLLKTLGATRAQIIRILLTEYALLGALGSLTGMVLAIGGGWGLVHYVFKLQQFVFAAGPCLAIVGAMMGTTVLIGVLAGRDVFRETAMTALRNVE